MIIKCIAVDDEPLALEKMEKYIAKVEHLKLVGSFDTGFEALNFIRNNPIDLLFLDIQMDELNGLQLLKVLPKKPKVVLTTAYDQYALQGYELDVVDYLLKPIGFQRFLAATEKVYHQLAKAPISISSKAQPIDPLDNCILIRSEYRLQKIRLGDILFIEGMKDYSRVFTTSTRIMTLQNLKKMEEALPYPPFMRVHKSFIVSLNKINSIGKNDLTIGEQTIPIGGLYKKQFQSYLKEQQLIG